MAVLNFRGWQLRSVEGPAAAQLDHKSRQIAVTGDIPEGYSWDLLVMAPSGATDVWSMTAVDDGLAVVVTRGMVPEEGRYAVQLRGTLQSDNDTQRHTNIVQLRVLPSITAGGKWPVLPTEFCQAEARLRDIAAHPPIPGDGVWQLWDSDAGAYKDSELPLPSGADGVTPHIGDNGNWYLGDEDTGVVAKGAKGDAGTQGPKGATGPVGPQGPAGAPGKEGTAGADGITPHIGDNGNWYIGTTDTGKPSRGATGANGSDGAQGEKGATGPAGIVISSTQPTGDTHPVWLDPNGDASTENPLNVTGATVGQIAVVAAVDDNGVPTAWEPADMASAGSETRDLSWKHIRDVELTPDAIEVIVSTTDAGNTFSYDEIMLEFVPNLAGYFYVRASQSSNLSTNVAMWVTNSKYTQMHLGLLGKKLAITSAFRTDGSLGFSNNYGGNGDIDKISKIVFGASPSVGAAFTVKIWGR